MLEGMTASLAVKIVAAVVLGGLIGFQREMAHKPAGLRTHILIVLGATVVMDVSHYAATTMGGDATRIAANIIVGIGFIGAGTIMKEGPTVHGLTSAATIWVDGALGTTIGSGYYAAAMLLTISTMIVLVFFARVEGVARKRCFVRRYIVQTTDSERVFSRISDALESSHLSNETIDLHRDGDRMSLTFTICEPRGEHNSLLESLRAMPEVAGVRAL